MDFFQNQHPVTDDQFFRFHGSDRRVYRRLVFNLRRDSTESSRVMAFWLWLEQTVKIHKRLSLIPCVILSLADKDLSSLADEAVAVLSCVEMDASYPPPPPVELPMTRRVVWKGQPVNLRFFYDNRLAVVRGVTEKSNSVCLRAFGDIMQRAVERRANEVTSQMMQASSSSAAAAAAAPSPTPVLLVNNQIPAATPVVAYYYTGHAGASSSNSSLDNNNNIPTITNSTGYGDSSASTDYHYGITTTNTNTAAASTTATTSTNTNNALTTRVDKNINNNNKKNKNNNNNMHSNINYKYFYTIGPSVSAERASRERRGEAIRAAGAPAIPAAAAAAVVVPMGGSGCGGGGARAKEEVEEMREIMRGLEIGLGGDDEEEEDRGILGYRKNKVNIKSINSVTGAGSERSKYNDYETFGFVNFDEPEEQLVPEDARTIFLTFSKGYPITETEVSDYFTSKYGAGLIEAIHMQEVRPNEQPLYARLVVRSLEVMNLFLRGHNRHKFSIAGKHVWARKYVRKAMANDASTSA